MNTIFINVIFYNNGKYNINVQCFYNESDFKIFMVVFFVMIVIKGSEAVNLPLCLVYSGSLKIIIISDFTSQDHGARRWMS